jgi:hypothetical protein
MIMIISCAIHRSAFYQPFSAPKKNLGGQKFKEDHEAENSCDTMTDGKDRDCYKQGTEKLKPHHHQFCSSGRD